MSSFKKLGKLCKYKIAGQVKKYGSAVFMVIPSIKYQGPSYYGNGEIDPHSMLYIDGEKHSTVIIRTVTTSNTHSMPKVRVLRQMVQRFGKCVFEQRDIVQQVFDKLAQTFIR